MMNIKPHDLIISGIGLRTAVKMEVHSQFDNLYTHGDFSVKLFDVEGNELVSCGVTLNGETEYKTWDASPLGAYVVCSKALKLQLE